jgi:hypothetical protein
MANTFRNASLAATTSAVSMYTTPASTTSVVHALYLSNIDGVSGRTVDIQVYDSSVTTAFFVVKAVPVPAGSSLVLDKPINLETGDELRITASSNSAIECHAAILEIV